MGNTIKRLAENLGDISTVPLDGQPHFPHFSAQQEEARALIAHQMIKKEGGITLSRFHPKDRPMIQAAWPEMCK